MDDEDRQKTAFMRRLRSFVHRPPVDIPVSIGRRVLCARDWLGANSLRSSLQPADGREMLFDVSNFSFVRDDYFLFTLRKLANV